MGATFHVEEYNSHKNLTVKVSEAKKLRLQYMCSKYKPSVSNRPKVRVRACMRVYEV